MKKNTVIQVACKSLVLLGGLAFLFPSHAGAESYSAGFYTRGVDAAYYLDSGDPVYDPFYVPAQRWALVPRLSISVSAEQTGDLSMDPDRTRSATIIRVIPGAMLIWGRPEARHLYLDYGLSIPAYTISGDFSDDPSHLLMLGGVFRTQKSQLHARFGFRRIEDLDTLVGARILKQDYVADVAVDHRVSTRTSVGVLGAYERHRFSADRFLGYDRLYGAARVYYDLSVKSQLFLQGGMGHDDVESNPEGYGNIDFHDVSVGMRGKPMPKTSVSGRVGYQWRTHDDDLRDDLERWIASLSANVNPLGFTTFSGTLYADLRPAIQEPGTTVIDQRVSVGAARRIVTNRLRGQANVHAGQIEYRGPIREPAQRETDFSLVYDRRQDEYWGYSLGLNYSAKHHVSFGLSYAYTENRAARDADRDVQRAASDDSGLWTIRFSWNY